MQGRGVGRNGRKVRTDRTNPAQRLLSAAYVGAEALERRLFLHGSSLSEAFAGDALAAFPSQRAIVAEDGGFLTESSRGRPLEAAAE